MLLYLILPILFIVVIGLVFESFLVAFIGFAFLIIISVISPIFCWGTAHDKHINEISQSLVNNTIPQRCHSVESVLPEKVILKPSISASLDSVFICHYTFSDDIMLRKYIINNYGNHPYTWDSKQWTSRVKSRSVKATWMRSLDIPINQKQPMFEFSFECSNKIAELSNKKQLNSHLLKEMV
jgi:hypothetical protein